MFVKQKWKWLPPWDMPSDPVRAVLWCSRWFLQVLVRYFSLLILVGVIYEAFLNGVVGLLGTLLVGLFVWACLAALLVLVNVTSGVSQVYTEVKRVRQNPYGFSSPRRSAPAKEEKIVEGSIITDLEEERRKRRQEI